MHVYDRVRDIVRANVCHYEWLVLWNCACVILMGGVLTEWMLLLMKLQFRDILWTAILQQSRVQVSLLFALFSFIGAVFSALYGRAKGSIECLNGSLDYIEDAHFYSVTQ